MNKITDYANKFRLRRVRKFLGRKQSEYDEEIKYKKQLGRLIKREGLIMSAFYEEHVEEVFQNLTNLTFDIGKLKRRELSLVNKLGVQNAN